MPPRDAEANRPAPPVKVDEQTVAIRIGCNFGPVVLENRDIFGSPFHTAKPRNDQPAPSPGRSSPRRPWRTRLSERLARPAGQSTIATLRTQQRSRRCRGAWQTEDITSDGARERAITSRERETIE